MATRKPLLLKKEVLAQLTSEQLAQIEGGAQTNGGLCAQLSIDFAGTCLGPTCGPGCTARSQITTEIIKD